MGNDWIILYRAPKGDKWLSINSIDLTGTGFTLEKSKGIILRGRGILRRAKVRCICQGRSSILMPIFSKFKPSLL